MLNIGRYSVYLSSIFNIEISFRTICPGVKGMSIGFLKIIQYPDGKFNPDKK